MNSKSHFFITIINLILLLILTVSYFMFTQKKDEIVYVDNFKLFSSFNMTKDLNRMNGLEIKKQKKSLDSLYTLYGILKNNSQTDKLETVEAQLRVKDQELKSMNERFSNEVSEAVWKRLNVYVTEYGLANDFKIILGTQGNGNVMYARAGIDITDAIVDYSNSNYEGER